MNEKITFENFPHVVSQLWKKLNSIEKLLEQRTEQYDSQSEKPLTVKEAAKFLNVKEGTVYTKVSNRELPYSKPDKKLYFFKSELLEYLKSNRKGTVSDIESEAHTYMKMKGVKND